MLILKITCLLSALGFAWGVDDPLYISAFNVQVFGKSKMDEPEVVQRLVDIILRYDMTIIQEIRDIDEVAFPELVQNVNDASGGQYDWIMSPRSGRTSSKEQYGYIYKPSRLVPTYAIEYPDDIHDIFEREPYIVTFQNLRAGAVVEFFNTIVLHAKPDDAVSEVSNLAGAYDFAVADTRIAAAVILGDLNADCSYITTSEWPQVKLCTDDRFTWKIPNSADTTVSSNTDCAYDRIVTAGPMTEYSFEAAVFNFQEYYGLDYYQTKDVSDHYPVEFKML